MRARESVWWLGINSDIEKEVKACNVCAKLQNDHTDLMICTKKIVSEYDKEIPQSQTADNPVAPPGRAAQPSRDTRKKN